MTSRVEFANSAGRIVEIDFGHEMEEAIKYCRTADEYHRVLVPYCEYCEKRMTQDDLPKGHLYGELCDECFDFRCCSLEEAGVEDSVIAEAAKFAQFEWAVWA